MSQKKKVLITFLGNLNYDTRCKNLFDTLSTNDFEVEFIGFDWLTSDFIESHGKISIYKLKKSFLSISFYLKFSASYLLKFSLKNHCETIKRLYLCSRQVLHNQLLLNPPGRERSKGKRS